MAAELNHSKVSSFDLEIMGQYQECYKRAQNIKSIPEVDLELRAKAYRSYLMSYYKLKTDLKLIWADSLLDPRHSVMIEARLKMARLKELNRDVKTLDVASLYQYSSLSFDDLMDRVKTFQETYAERSSRLKLSWKRAVDRQCLRGYLNIYHSLKFNLRLLLQRVEISEPLVKSNWEAYQLDMRTAHRKFIFLRSDEQSKALGLSIAISELTVEKMPAKEWDRLVEVLDGWYFSSHLKYLSIHKELPLQSPLDHDPGGVFLSAHVICDLISRHLRNQENTENRLRSPRRVLVCRDRLRSVQAVALFNKKEHSLTYLVTHPDNIRHPINEHISTRAQGAGTQIILYLARLALKRNMPLWAIIRDDSEPFYQKLHFDDDAAFGKKILTVEKIKQLVSLKIFPFSLLSQ